MTLASDVLYVQGLLSLVTYRPGWTIEAFPTPYHRRVWLLIDAEVLDSERYDPSIPVEENYARGNTTRVGVRAVVPEFRVPDFELADAFYNWLGWRLIRCERHESREFFQVGGRPWDSPHKKPQPPADYYVRKRGGVWIVTDGSGPPRSTWDTWLAAQKDAWARVIQDDSYKGEDMVNG